jgi:hypothetical protein
MVVEYMKKTFYPPVTAFLLIWASELISVNVTEEHSVVG